MSEPNVVKKKKQVKITKSVPAPNAPFDMNSSMPDMLNNLLSNPALLQSAMKGVIPNAESDPRFQEFMKNPKGAMDLMQSHFGGAQGLSSMMSSVSIGDQQANISSANDDILADLQKNLNDDKLKAQADEVKSSQKMIPVSEGQIYIAFNSTMLNFFDWIAAKIPERKKDYALMKNMFQFDVGNDKTRPLKLFREAIRGHEHCLTEFSDENLLYFLQTAPKIQLLAELQINEYYKQLTRPDWIELWKFLKTLKDFSLLPDFIPQDLMSRLEKLVGGLTQQKDWQELAPKFVADPKGKFKEAFQKMYGDMVKDPNMLQGLRQFQDEITSRTQIIKPDTTNPHSKKYQQFDEHVKEELTKPETKSTSL